MLGHEFGKIDYDVSLQGKVPKYRYHKIGVEIRITVSITKKSCGKGKYRTTDTTKIGINRG